MEDIRGNFLFVFQPHEELPPGGAKAMVEEGVLEETKLSAMLGIHMNPFVEAGKIAIRPGQLNAAADRFIIRVQGAGGHAAYPHRVRDPVPVAAEIITALHRVVSREVNPFDSAVLTIGRLRAGEEFNVVPDFVEMAGTVRSIREDTRERIRERIEKIAQSIAQAWGMEACVQYEYGYPPLFNDEGLYEIAREVILGLFGEDGIAQAKPSMGGEDFAYFGQHLPVLMSYLGVKKGENPAPFHSARFDMDDSQLWKGAAFLAGLGVVIAGMKNRT